MSDDVIKRRDFLTGAGIVATAVTSGAVPADGQATGPFPAANPVRRAADLVLRNGNILTVDFSFTIARAIAIAGDRITAVGSDEAMTPHIGPGTRVLDLKGKTVIPGLLDSHAHMDREGLKTIFPSLGRVAPSLQAHRRLGFGSRSDPPHFAYGCRFDQWHDE